MAHLIEPAPTARAKCRGCGERLAAGQLRFGEVLPNPFAEGEMTQWFHLECAAFKRPGALLEALEARGEPLEQADGLRTLAQPGIAHERLTRLSGAERAPTGRAQCRACREAIAKDAWRLSLLFYEEGRFSPAGYLHTGCARGYFETGDTEALMLRVRRFAPGLAAAELAELEAALSAPAPGHSSSKD